MTYRECYEKGCLALQTAGIEEATLDARLLLEAVCGTNRNDLLVHGEQLVTPEAEEKYFGWIGHSAATADRGAGLYGTDLCRQ
mgnify:CR=1 FL=1